ncbi:class I SAM-dependent methyltransferase [Polyangium sp. 15x6]|uniref:class I SAM-dependent methyltransferase n=1 Tax=Polyangium sp. 15x6 TaxID=3042687 RepID=UPI00249BF99E|nr:class I SAM-dependent methyltransferase [Polyangium sp. 15x6]MDI3282855.1 class I SAM-dependent methyltransferase [Polyangium sp. 15x6]
MSWKKYLLLPQLLSYAARAPRDPAKAWDRFWSGIRRTGNQGEVLWDTEDPREIEEILNRVTSHFAPELPVIDIGCGNGRFSRLLAAHYSRVVGLDVSSHAIEKAREESAGMENLSFHVADVSVPYALRWLVDELGEANVFMRGVLHVHDPKRRAVAIENMRGVLGARGVLYLSESSIDGDPLDHMVLQGATPTYMPEPVRRVVAAGVRPPSRFGDAEVREYFPGAAWEILESGPTVMYTLPLRTPDEIEALPSYFALVRRRG